MRFSWLILLMVAGIDAQLAGMSVSDALNMGQKTVRHSGKGGVSGEFGEIAASGPMAVLQLDSKQITDLKGMNQVVSPELVTDIYLSFNDVTEIGSNAFSAFPNVLRIFLNGNKIKKIDGKAFDGLAYLTVLDLSSNALSSVPTDIFSTSKCPKLQTLIIHSNHFGMTDAEFRDKYLKGRSGVTLNFNPQI